MTLELKFNFPLDSGEKQHHCNFCEKKFKRSTHARRHELTHGVEHLHLCSYCDSRFLTSNDRKKHESTHVSRGPYSCDICEKVFKWQSNMKEHKKRHTNEKRFPCTYCEGKFHTSWNKKMHEKRHEGKQKYSYKICKNSLLKSSALEKHKKTHAKEIQNGKPYLTKEGQTDSFLLMKYGIKPLTICLKKVDTSPFLGNNDSVAIDNEIQENGMCHKIHLYDNLDWHIFSGF